MTARLYCFLLMKLIAAFRICFGYLEEMKQCEKELSAPINAFMLHLGVFLWQMCAFKGRSPG